MPNIWDNMQNLYQSTAPQNASNPYMQSTQPVMQSQAPAPIMQSTIPAPQNTATPYNQSQPGSVLGAQATPQPMPQPAPTGLGGGGGSNLSAGVSGLQSTIDSLAASQAAQAAKVKDQRIAANLNSINSQYDALYGGLDTAGQQAQNSFGSTQDIINTQAANSQQKLDTAKTQALATTAGQKTENELQKRGVLAQVGQAFANAKQGLQNFLGARGLGDSSAAQATGELLYRQSQGDIAGAEQSAQQNMAKIQEAERNIETFHQESVGDLQTAVTTEIAKARNVLDNELARISGLRTTYGKSKQADIEAAQSEAWNNFQNSVFEINQQAAEQKYSLDQWKMEKQAAVSNAGKLAQMGTPEIVPLSTDQAGNVLSYQLYQDGVPLGGVKQAPPPSWGSSASGGGTGSIWDELGLGGDTAVSSQPVQQQAAADSGGYSFLNNAKAGLANFLVPGLGETLR